MKEYVVYKSYLSPSSKKGELPDVVYDFLADTPLNPSYSSDIGEAYRFYELEEAKNAAYLLNMKVGEIELKVSNVR